jgi:hypothetical protein
MGAPANSTPRTSRPPDDIAVSRHYFPSTTCRYKAQQIACLGLVNDITVSHHDCWFTARNSKFNACTLHDSVAMHHSVCTSLRPCLALTGEADEIDTVVKPFGSLAKRWCLHGTCITFAVGIAVIRTGACK